MKGEKAMGKRPGIKREEKAPGEAMPEVSPGAFQTVPHDTVDLVVPNGQTSSPWVHIGSPSECGFFVPTITLATVTVEVAYASDGTGGGPLVDGGGAARLTWAAGTGNFRVSTNDMGAVLGYPYMRVVCGAVQGAERTFKLLRKAVQTYGG
jgi:hypothetical protein